MISQIKSIDEINNQFLAQYQQYHENEPPALRNFLPFEDFTQLFIEKPKQFENSAAEKQPSVSVPVPVSVSVSAPVSHEHHEYKEHEEKIQTPEQPKMTDRQLRALSRKHLFMMIRDLEKELRQAKEEKENLLLAYKAKPAYKKHRSCDGGGYEKEKI